MTAFGPFPGTETIDFDALNDAGVFLLTGQTGAGKTSVLDAVCFALYGVVPGERGVKTLRSHHAAADVAPGVELELTLGSRRLRVHRSPAWLRPKRRGDGLTTQNASARLIDLTDGEERLVSNRADEVGHELGALLQMSSEQFMQVVMLPQGGFQTFLRATSDERQEVLQRLFGTERFARVEQWVRDHSRDLGEASDAARLQVERVLAALVHRAGVEPPGGLLDAPDEVAPPLSAWAAGLVTALAAERAAAVAEEHAAAHDLAVAEEHARQATRTAAALRRRLDAEARMEELRAAADEAEAAEQVLDRARAAEGLAPLLDELSRRSAETERLARAADEALAAADARRSAAGRSTSIGWGGSDESADAVGGLAGDVGPAADLDDEVRRTLAGAARLRSLLPRQAELVARRAELASAQVRAQAGARELSQARLALDLLPEQLADVRQQIDSSLALADDLGPRRESLAACELRLRAARALAPALDLVGERETASARAREAALLARERHLDLLDRRLAGMAGELAGRLVEGEPCAVCGSEAHPAPARAGDDGVSEEQQRVARLEAETAQTHRERAEAALAEARDRAAELARGADGRDAGDASAELAAAREAVASAERAAASLPGLFEAKDGLLAAEHDARSRIDALALSLATTEGTLASLRDTVAALSAEVAAELGDPDTPIDELLRDQLALHTLLERARDAARARDDSLRALHDLRADADATAREQGFADTDDARAARLDAPARARLADLLALRASEVAAMQAVLADAEVRATDGLVEVDLDGPRAAAAEHRAAWRRAGDEVARLSERCAAAERLATEVARAASAWDPLRRQHRTADQMSRLVRGVGGDNQLQMRLSSYVLATRLDQVLEAANRRLADMRDHRYLLRRGGEQRGGRRTGLDLEVLDEWTGEARSPRTLSGGETFVVSLALALGLADVVQAEAGGIGIETLFVDEGFGMLDPDTLDDVMDRIDALRAGGRAVGVVSHVSELRSRIPTQVHIDRGRAGSTISVRSCVA